MLGLRYSSPPKSAVEAKNFFYLAGLPRTGSTPDALGAAREHSLDRDYWFVITLLEAV